MTRRTIALTFKTKLTMIVDENISDEEIINNVYDGYSYAGGGYTLSLPGDIKEEMTYDHKIEEGVNYSKDDK